MLAGTSMGLRLLTGNVSLGGPKVRLWLAEMTFWLTRLGAKGSLFRVSCGVRVSLSGGLSHFSCVPLEFLVLLEGDHVPQGKRPEGVS